jgi:hydrogenase maturation protein HypF
VGFRPFVYRLACELALDGWVGNDPRGVLIEAEGERGALERFLDRLVRERPAPAEIETLRRDWLEPAGYRVFRIEKSGAQGARTTQVLPDIATCDACLAELADPADRRHAYPFTNCTHCGPRFSILRSLPYDRPRTTMASFVLCDACRAEYEDPSDRRFHAQPNACPQCGPRLTLLGPGGTVQATGPAALEGAAASLRCGKTLALKGLGGFQLMVDARDGEALRRLRERKPRRERPFALMVRDLDEAARLCLLDAPACAALRSPQAPIVLLPRLPGTEIHASVAPGNPFLGLMLPTTPLHHLLLRALAFPVVATSGNLAEEPICIDETEALARLGGIADRFLVHDRPIERHVDDSVAWVIRDEVRVLRRARGYAPRPVGLQRPVPTILALGAHLKSSVALGVGRQVFLSQHIGDMETPQARTAFERVIADFLRLYEARPRIVAHDLHPDYASTRWAEEVAAGDRRLGTEAAHADRAPPRLASVQHHHAHLAACLAENGCPGPALGVTWDGTGYGLDGTIWGGEFLLGTPRAFTRVAHLRPFRLPGGEAAMREPRRSAVGLLHEALGPAALDTDLPGAAGSFQPAERDLLGRMLERGVNAPVTTSAGRLFDAVAALIGPWQRISFEGQAAMALEFMAERDERGAYPLDLVPLEAPAPGASRAPRNGPDADAVRWMLDWRPLLETLLADRRRGVPAGRMAARFHNALCSGIVCVAQAVGEATVVLSGGCFQNRRLVECTASALEAAGFHVLLHRQVPPNDGGISLGQVAVAAARAEQTA